MPWVGATALTAIAIGIFAMPEAASAGRGDGGVIYVTGQDLFYDTIGAADLPMRGPFQRLVPGGPSDAYTEYGPGDPGYVGGRWWVDLDGNDEMDPDDRYFECPLLGPGRESP
jgi:hypothetical protein